MLHQETENYFTKKEKRINQNVQLVPRGSEIGFDQDSNWTFEELADLKPDYRQDCLSHLSLRFHKLSANFPFQHANFSGDRYWFSNTMNETQRKFLSLSNTRKVTRLS